MFVVILYYYASQVKPSDKDSWFSTKEKVPAKFESFCISQLIGILSPDPEIKFSFSPFYNWHVEPKTMGYPAKKKEKYWNFAYKLVCTKIYNIIAY